MNQKYQMAAWAILGAGFFALLGSSPGRCAWLPTREVSPAEAEGYVLDGIVNGLVTPAESSMCLFNCIAWDSVERALQDKGIQDPQLRRRVVDILKQSVPNYGKLKKNLASSDAAPSTPGREVGYSPQETAVLDGSRTAAWTIERMKIHQQLMSLAEKTVRDLREAASQSNYSPDALIDQIAGSRRKAGDIINGAP